MHSGAFRFLHDAQPPSTAEEIQRYVEAWSEPGAATAMINDYRFAVRHGSGEIHPIADEARHRKCRRVNEFELLNRDHGRDQRSAVRRAVHAETSV
jgi:hypothetical protein